MTTNYEDRVPETLRNHTAAAFERAVEDRKAHRDAEGFVQSLVLAAYTWQHPSYQPASSNRIIVEIPGLTVPGVGSSDCRWNAERTDSAYTYRIIGDPNAVAVGRFKASLRKFLGLPQ